ncbi:unnamed protein product [Hymenolepis diminuta]|uniref:DNA helicase n=1 Tax=Hymenolepis diminuta TaxID=6216 RepID=A0A0R3SEV4_HYMDI|nr:unnamed protein product [Hymenolepis diminuta]VUZ51442.1 unnamed protein product [Hymenolepis diminuta]
MVDEFGPSQRKYSRLNDSTSKDEGDEVRQQNTFQQNSGRRPEKSRKQNIQTLREDDFDLEPNPFDRGRGHGAPSRYLLDSSDNRSAESSSESEASESESSTSSDLRVRRNYAIKDNRGSVRTRGRRVNYANAFKEESDSESDTLKRPNSREVDSRNSRAFQPASFNRFVPPIKREATPEETNGGGSSGEESQSPVHIAASSYPGAANAPPFGEMDVIEEVLKEEVRRKSATGDPTTLYNCIDYDPNAGFDPKNEEGETMYLIKWRNWSHLHCTWETEASLTDPGRYNSVDGLKKLYNFQYKMSLKKNLKETAGPEELENILYEEESEDVVLQEKMEVERIISHCRDRDEANEVDYLCKFKRMDYQSATWETGSVIKQLFPQAVDDYDKRLASTKLPNFRRDMFARRPKFVPIPEQPEYIGAGNPDLRLRDYQLKGLNWMAHAWTRSNSVILADEMGLGKTVQAISFLSYLFHEHGLYGPFLIVVPLSTISSWQREIELWAPFFNLIVYVGNCYSREVIRDYEWSQSAGFVSRKQQRLKFNICMTTYEILLKDKTFLGQVPWAALVVDEAHRLKNDASQLYQALSAFDTDTRLLITGTPLQNSLKELWSLLHFLNPSYFTTWEEFEEEYSFSSQLPVSDSHDGFSRLHRVIEPYLLRRVKKDVEQSLPAKTERILRVEMSKRQATLYRLILARNYDGLMKVTGGGHKASFINIVMQLKKCCNHAYLIDPPDDKKSYRGNEEALRDLIKGSGKMMLLDKLLLKLKPQGHRVLIFSQMVKMLDIIADYLTLRSWGFQRLDGSIRGDLRKQTLDHFNAEGSTDFCFLLSTRAGGLGINLATADTVIIFDSDWNPQNDLQAQARAHRIGQTKQVSVYRLVVKESVEEKIIESATRKMLLDFLVIQRMDTAGSRRKTDPKAKLLTDILQHGAEGIFRQNEEELGDIEVDIDDILNTAETRNAETEDESHGLLSAFNVVNLNQLEEDDKIAMEEKPTTKSWSEIIPEEMRRNIKEDEDQKALMNLITGPRLRKQVKSFHAGADKAYSSSDSDSEDEQQNNGQKLAHLSPKDIRAVVKALRRFARPLERIDAIAAEAELSSLTNKEISDIVQYIIDGCKSAVESPTIANQDGGEETKNKAPVFNYGKVAIQAKQILQSLSNLENLYQVMPKSSKEDRLNYELPFTPRFANWPSQWSATDDVHLLVGVYEHGYDNWDAIKLDPDLGLASKMLPINSNERPQASHIRARVDYLLKALSKQVPSGTSDKKKERKSHGKSSSSKDHMKKSSSKRHNHSMDYSSKSGTKPKSAEFVESDGTSESDSKASSKNTVPPIRIKKNHKRELKVENVYDQSPAKRSKYSDNRVSKDEPVHYTALPVSISELTKEEEAEIRNMDGGLFLECKERFHPIKKALKQLKKLDYADTLDTERFNEILLQIGAHIRKILSEISEDRAKRRKWKHVCWLFLEHFSRKTGSELEELHHSIRKSSLVKEKDSNRHNRDDDRKHGDKHHDDHHHHSSRHENDDKHFSHGHHGRSYHHRGNSSDWRSGTSNGVHYSSNPGDRRSGGGDWTSNRQGFNNAKDWASKNGRDNRNDRFKNAFNNEFNDAFNNPGMRDHHGVAPSSHSSIPPPYSFQRPPTTHYSWQYRPSNGPLLPSPTHEGSIIPPPISSIPPPRDPRLSWNSRP